MAITEGPKARQEAAAEAAEPCRQALRPAEMYIPRSHNCGVAAAGEVMIFVAGQSGRQADGALAGDGDVVAQARQALTNVRCLVEAGGGAMADVCRLGVQVRDMAAYVARSAEFAALFGSFFADGLPAMSLCEVARFVDPEVEIEVDGIAVVPPRA